MFKKVLVAVDVAVPGEAQSVLEAAKSLTSGWDCELHAVTVIPDVGMAIVGSYFDAAFENDSQSAASQELAKAVSETGIAATETVLGGRVYDSVLSHAKAIDADLIMVVAHQPELRDYLLGVNAARIVRHASQSVMVIRR